eukprot:2715525-Pyramimonas_sp.AAC.1
MGEGRRFPWFWSSNESSGGRGVGRRRHRAATAAVISGRRVAEEDIDVYRHAHCGSSPEGSPRCGTVDRDNV